MILDERISGLIGRIYSAGNEAAEWDGVSREVVDLCGGHGALLTLVDLTHRSYSASHFIGLEQSSAALGFEEYAEIYPEDPSLQWASQHPDARFCDSQVSVGDSDYLANPFVRWNRARFGSSHWYVGYTPPADGVSTSFSLHFPATQGPGTAAQLQLFRLLFDHLECALRLARRPAALEGDASVVLLGPDGRATALSAAAEALLKAEDGLALRARQLIPSHADDREMLSKAIGRTLAALESGATPEAVRVRRPSGRPWLLLLKPRVQAAGPFTGIPNGIIVQIRGGPSPIVPPEMARQLFGLSDREIAIAQLIAEGHSPESAANALGISPHTARAHLRAVFAKTATHRQAELVQLWLNLAG